MNHYTKLAGVLKREILNFSEKICKGLWKPEQRLVTCMIYGIAESGSCHLSKIGRALKEKISLKKLIERLSMGLRDFSEKDRQILLDNYTQKIKPQIDTRTVFLVDDSDVTKPHSYKMEHLEIVRDGSTGEYEKGYWTTEIAALTTTSKSPLPVYDRVYSVSEKGFISANEEVFKGLRYLSKTFGNVGIRALDRGYDGLDYYKYFIKNREAFVIRATKNRSVRYKNKTENILKVANQFKGKYRIDFKNKKGKQVSCKIAVVPISLPKYPNVPLNMVVVHGFGKDPMMLVTNLQSDDKRLADTIVKVYLLRWRIEEYFRFKKQQYHWEDFRVRSLNAIRTLYRILNLLTGLIGLLSEKRTESIFVMQLIDASKRIYRPKKGKEKRYFLFYAIGDAFFDILRKTTVGISHFLAPPPPSNQLSFLQVAEMGKL